MHVLGIATLETFGKKHTQAKKPLQAWLKIARQTSWRHLMEVRMNYPSADGGVKGNHTVFNIKGNDYRLVAIINFRTGSLLITDVFTHAEYDRWSSS